MNKLVFFLALCSVLAYQFAKANKCKEDFNKMKEAVKGLMDKEDAPECVKKYELKKYQCTGGKDKEEDKKKHEEFKEMMKGLEEEDQENVMKCLEDLSNAAMEEVGDQISDECKEKMEEMKKKMKGEE